MSEIDELFKEGREIAEHVGMTELGPHESYVRTKDKEEFIRTLLDYIYWLNEKKEPVEEIRNPKINQQVIDYYRRASDFGE